MFVNAKEQLTKKKKMICKHIRLVAEIKNNNSFVYETEEFGSRMMPSMRQILKPKTIISYCADCGKKIKEVEEK